MASNKLRVAEWGLSYSFIQQPVEQQSIDPNGMDQSLWVVNPTNDVWDPDDERDWLLRGPLAPGESAFLETALWADWVSHVSVIQGSIEGLLLEVAVGDHSVSGSISAAIVGPEYDSSSTKLTDVLGSNGGRALLIPVRFKVTNTTNHRIRDLMVFAVIGDPDNPVLQEKCGGLWTDWPVEGSDPSWRTHIR